MGSKTKAVEHMKREEIIRQFKRIPRFREFQKWLVVWNALVDPRPAKEIALHTGLATQTVHNLISAYNRKGKRGIEGPGRGGRRREYLSLEEEEHFLENFEDRAGKGLVATGGEIKKSLEAQIGQRVHKMTIYRLLGRHGWRKVAPRPSHVKKDEKSQIEFKKNCRSISRKS